jgi:hypothetical protein
MYLAPILLKGCFTKKRYYKHMCALVKIMKMMLRFKLTLEEIDRLEVEIIDWVKGYEQ